MNIDIGGGTLSKSGWVNLDPMHGQGAWKRIAQDVPWPTGDNTVQTIRASHVMEHIPSGQPRIDVMNEAHRVLAPGGIFAITVPFMVGTWQAIADPTHVSFWCKESFHYFDGLFAPNADYGIKFWTTLKLTVSEGWEGYWEGTPR